MARKDWKLKRAGKYNILYKNEKKNKELIILGYYVGEGKYNWSWSVFDDEGEVIDGSQTPNLTKQEAISRANKYMETH